MTSIPAPVFFFLNTLSFVGLFKGKVGSRSLVVLDMFAFHRDHRALESTSKYLQLSLCALLEACVWLRHSKKS